ncbi:beta-mannanase [Thermodesulfomicrobium sp. WS]|uniref:glycoside hydrolase family 26 protein n=1 Tax=Thermodesulfomicrobium sp. WS TaxID=3004129 RepID=UPI0024931BAB|nr:glycosyl hydrolase [Thermodesulfomicrobium sp. WS]BDV00025.1 beta-mannanase [Thermodesulfomicrobium sp. WS]
MSRTHAAIAGFWIAMIASLLGPALGRTETVPENATLAIPPQGIYFGAYIDAGPAEDDVSHESIAAFETMVGKRVAILAFSSYWGRNTFPEAQVRIAHHRGMVPLIYWSPWEYPFPGLNAPNPYSLHAIIQGQWDDYIRRWAKAAAATRRPILVAFGIEMNGEWFPWSGIFHGAGTPTAPGAFSPWAGPDAYIRAYRHVVDLARAQGAKNIRWVFHVNNTSNPDAPWNQPAAYDPGDDYVDILAMSAYGKQYPGPGGWIPFRKTIDPFYPALAAIHPHKPILLAEWGIGEFPASGDKASYLREALALLPRAYPRLMGAVFWHERWENSDGRHSNLRVNSSRASLDAFRQGIADPLWLARPIWKTP